MPLLTAWLLPLSPPKLVRMGIFYADREVGEATYEQNSDGRFVSRVKASLDTEGISGTVEGRLSGEEIVRFDAHSKLGGAEIDVAYAARRLRVRSGGSDRVMTYAIGRDFATGLHPQLTAALLRRVGHDMKPGQERRLETTLLDLGAKGQCIVRDDGLKPYGSQTAHEYRVDYGAMSLQFAMDARGTVVAMTVPAQRLRYVASGWEGLDARRHESLSVPQKALDVRRGQRMRLRDGTVLIADIVKPEGKGPFPAILERTPYGRAGSLADAKAWASYGYAYIAQDCRGTGNSAGDFDPLVNEGKDGYDAVEWVAHQPWCDRHVGMIGTGYAGTDQWQAAVQRPPSLRCIVPQFALGDGMRGFPYEYGTFDLEAAFAGMPFADRNAEPARKLQPATDLPLSRLGRTHPFYQSWIRRTTLGDWSGDDHLDRLEDVQVPALHVSGWHDPNEIGTKLAWEAMRRAGRKDQWLVCGPWSSLPQDDADLETLTLRFFDTYLKGKAVGLEEVPRVRAYVTGANRWLEMDGWPSSASPLETLYLAPKTLQKTPGANGASVYVYSPSKDRGVAIGALPPNGTYALFQASPVDQATAIAGPFEVRLFFKSSAKDTDLFATLLDVAPDGSIGPIGRPGKLRASYRHSLIAPSLLMPGRNYAGLLRPWDEAHELAKGHRLGLLVQSSLYPRYARNLGTGEPLATGKTSTAQRNVILTGTVTPSRITYRRLW